MVRISEKIQKLRLREISLDDLLALHKRSSIYRQIVEDFLAGNDEVAELPVEWRGSARRQTAERNLVCRSLRHRVKELAVSVAITTRQGRIFLLREKI